MENGKKYNGFTSTTEREYARWEGLGSSCVPYTSSEEIENSFLLAFRLEFHTDVLAGKNTFSEPDTDHFPSTKKDPSACEYICSSQRAKFPLERI